VLVGAKHAQPSPIFNRYKQSQHEQ